MNITELIKTAETEFNTAAQQTAIWRERQLRAEGALTILRAMAAEGESPNESVNNDTGTTGAGDGPSF